MYGREKVNSLFYSSPDSTDTQVSQENEIGKYGVTEIMLIEKFASPLAQKNSSLQINHGCILADRWARLDMIFECTPKTPPLS